MGRPVSAMDARNSGKSATLYGHPDKCPRCHRNISPTWVAARESYLDGGSIEEVYQCTSSQCGATFIAIFKYQGGSSGATYDFSTSIPTMPAPPDIAEDLLGLSPTFGEVYTQALASEEFGLTQLTGIGLRKALEFLVKDFASSRVADEAEREEVLKKSLAKCIDDYITDVTVKEVAHRARWLGNDETHYLRKWEDRDIKDLKTLIKLTMNGLANVLMSERYIAEMKSKPGSS